MPIVKCFSGLSLFGLAVMAFVPDMAGAALFTIDGDGAYTANIIRRFDASGTMTTTVSSYNPNNYHIENGGLMGGVNGGYSFVQWTTSGDNGGANNPAATAGMDITLDSVYSIKKFGTRYGHMPANYKIEVSTTGFNALSTAVGLTATASHKIDVLATAMDAKYIRYTWVGTAATHFPQVQEFHAYADAATNAFPLTIAGGYDIVGMGSPTIVTTDLTPGKWIDVVTRATDLNENTFLRGAGVGDAQFLVDLGSANSLNAISLGFYPDQSWANGVKIEGSLDGTNFTSTLVDNIAMATGTPWVVAYSFTPTEARYLRVTNKSGAGGALSDFQVFAPVPVPEPGLGLLAIGALAMLRRLRECRDAAAFSLR